MFYRLPGRSFPIPEGNQPDAASSTFTDTSNSTLDDDASGGNSAARISRLAALANLESELQYWLILFFVFAVITTLYAGLVTCFHLVFYTTRASNHRLAGFDPETDLGCNRQPIATVSSALMNNPSQFQNSSTSSLHRYLILSPPEYEAALTMAAPVYASNRFVQETPPPDYVTPNALESAFKDDSPTGEGTPDSAETNLNENDHQEQQGQQEQQGDPIQLQPLDAEALRAILERIVDRLGTVA